MDQFIEYKRPVDVIEYGATFKNRNYVFNEIEDMATQAAQAYNQIEEGKCQSDSNLLP